VSSVLALAGVTAVLQDMIGNRLAAEPLATALGTVQVTALPPDRVELTESADPMQVNAFLHQVTPNPGWANLHAPERSSSGARISAPPLVLDLHYLITVYAASPLRSEMLLAAVAQTFAETPVPDRATIVAAINPTVPPSGFPPGLADCGLEDQFEHLRITPQAMSGEEVSKLWSALQARYRPTLGFRVTTVIIDSEARASAPLPAMRAGIRATPLRRPEIARIEATSGPRDPIIAGSTVLIHGTQLASPKLRLTVGDVDMSAAISDVAEHRLRFDLPSPGSLRAGAHTVSVGHLSEVGQPPTLRETSVSNPAVMVLRPQVSGTFAETASQLVDGVSLRSGNLTLNLVPEVEPSQRVTAVLNASDGSGRSYSFTAPSGNGIAAPATSSGSVVLPITDVAAGSYFLRAQVDAGESVLAQNADGSFTGPLLSV
jgi:hypothetical protein